MRPRVHIQGKTLVWGSYAQDAHTFPFNGIDGLAGEWVYFMCNYYCLVTHKLWGHALALECAYWQGCLLVYFFIHPFIFLWCSPGWSRTHYIIQTNLEFGIPCLHFPSVQWYQAYRQCSNQLSRQGRACSRWRCWPLHNKGDVYASGSEEGALGKLQLDHSQVMTEKN